MAEDQRRTRDSSCASAPVTAAPSRTSGAEGTCGVNTRDPARPTGHGRPATRAREQLSQCAVGSAHGLALGSAVDPALQPPRSPAMYAEMRRRRSAHFFSKLRRTGVKISPSSARPVTRGGSAGLPGAPGWSRALDRHAQCRRESSATPRDARALRHMRRAAALYAHAGEGTRTQVNARIHR